MITKTIAKLYMINKPNHAIKIIYKSQILCQFSSCSVKESSVKLVKMIALLLLCLGVSSISSHPVSGGKACLTLTSFQKSLDNAVMCKDFQPKSKYFVHQAMELKFHPFSFQPNARLQL